MLAATLGHTPLTEWHLGSAAQGESHLTLFACKIFVLFELDHNSAKSFKAFFFFLNIMKLETWGEIKGQNIQWKGRWVLTFGKEGFLRVTSESPR